MRPIFGDKETLKQIDPYRKLLDEGITIPKEDVPCRFCCGALTIEFDDTWIEGHEFGAGTIRWDCETEPDMESDAWDDWMDSHAYVYQHEQWKMRRR